MGFENNHNNVEVVVKQEKGKKRIVIRDIAKAANCSTATVSRVLSKSDYPISADLRQRVLDAAYDFGYSPNPYGRILRTSVNHSIGIIIPSFQNPFFSQIIMGIEHIASKRGYTPMVFASQRDPNLERQYIKDMTNKRISSLMLCSVDDSSDTLEQYLESGGHACVFESNFHPLDSVLNASADMFKAAQIATEYLISQGHHQIAFLTPPLSRSSRHQRVDGCRFAMAMHGLEFSSEDIISIPYEDDVDECLYEYNNGIALAKKMLIHNKKYTAVIALNDLIACGIIAGLTQSGIRVPEDISVIGFDDIPNAVMVTPQLTTVRLSGHLIGQRATQMMIDAFESNESGNRVTLSITPTLVVRNSVANIQNKR